MFKKQMILSMAYKNIYTKFQTSEHILFYMNVTFNRNISCVLLSFQFISDFFLSSFLECSTGLHNSGKGILVQ